MAGRTIAEAASERETLTRDPLMWHGTIVTQDRLCSEMLATFRMSRAKSGLSTNGPTPVIPAALIFVSTGFIPLGVGISNLLMIGPPGAGKSLLASCLPGILPPLSPSEALEVSMVQSVAGTLEEGRISRTRPFRAPHHSASMAALTGGGVKSLGKRDSAPHRARFSFRVTGGKLNKFRKAITYRACALRPTFFCQPSIPRIFG